MDATMHVFTYSVIIEGVRSSENAYWYIYSTWGKHQLEICFGFNDQERLAILGHYTNGYYLCIPDEHMGCTVFDWTYDISWNYGQICDSLPARKHWLASLIAYGLNDFGTYSQEHFGVDFPPDSPKYLQLLHDACQV